MQQVGEVQCSPSVSGSGSGPCIVSCSPAGYDQIVNHQHPPWPGLPCPGDGDCTNVLFEECQVTRVFFPQILIYLGWNLTPPPVFVIKIVIFYKVRMTGRS